MAINKVREDRFAQKKSECFFAAEVNEGAESYEISAATDDYLMANLPPNSLITDAYIMVDEPSDAATSAVAKLGTTEGGSEILSSADLTSAGKQGTFASDPILTGTGVPLYLGVTVAGAATEVGKYILVVEYLEYRKNTGEYTSF